MRAFHVCLATLAFSGAALGQVAAPAAPSLTAGPDFKGLRFDWEPVAGATHYELEYKAGQSSAFVQLGNALPANATSFRYRLPLHLFDWTYARYRLAACNATGCTRSGEVSVSSVRRYAVGYFKAGDSQAGIRFGTDTDISPDGLNLVTSAPLAFNDNGGLSVESGAIYVFRRGPNGAWEQRAKLLPELSPGPGIAMRVSISADGNTVAVGMPQFFHEGGNYRTTGEVFVFHFDGTSWERTRLDPDARDDFGRWVALNDAGDTLAISAGTESTSVFMYRLASGVWQPVRELINAYRYCNDGALSGDGSTVVESCNGEFGIGNAFVSIHSGPDWSVRTSLPLSMATPSGGWGYELSSVAVDTTGDTVAAQLHVFGGPAQVNVFRKTAGVYAQVAELQPGAWRTTADRETFGLGLAMSGDGGTIAVGDSLDNGLGAGPRAAPLNAGTARTGAVYVWRLRGTWRLANVVKPNYRPAADQRLFGREVALNGNGHTLIVGERGESSDARGIGGDWSDDDAFDSGAVWMY